MADITTPVLNLKSLEIDETGDSGVNIHLSGVAPGIINSILRLMKITGTTDLRMNASYLELRSGSASGQRSWFVPTGSLSSVQGGYRKDISAIFIGILLFVGGIAADIAMENLLFTWIGLFFALVLIAVYIFTKTMYMEIESGGGITARVQFKGAIELTKVEDALAIMQALIAKAQYPGDVRIMGKLTEVIIPSDQNISISE